MVASTRRSRRVNIQDGGLPLPAGHADSYGENNEIAPARSGRRQATSEDDNNVINHEFYNETFSLSEGQQRSTQTQQRRQGQHAQRASNPIGDAINNINRPTHSSQDTQETDFGNLQDEPDFIPPVASRPAFPENHRLYPDDDDPWNLRDEPGNRNLYPTGLQNPYQTPFNTRWHPSEPANSLASKWGMAGGRPSPYPLSARSFMHEERLYGSAAIKSPSIPPPPEWPAQQHNLSAEPRASRNSNQGTSKSSSRPTTSDNTPVSSSTNNTARTETINPPKMTSTITGVNHGQDTNGQDVDTTDEIDGESPPAGEETTRRHSGNAQSEAEPESRGGEKARNLRPPENITSHDNSSSAVDSHQASNNTNNIAIGLDSSDLSGGHQQTDDTTASSNSGNDRQNSNTNTIVNGNGNDRQESHEPIPPAGSKNDSIRRSELGSYDKLRNRMGYNNPPSKNNLEPWTRRDDLTEAQQHEADNLRHRRRLEQQPDRAAPASQKPTPPIYPVLPPKQIPEITTSGTTVMSGSKGTNSASSQVTSPTTSQHSSETYTYRNTQIGSQHGIPASGPNQGLGDSDNDSIGMENYRNESVDNEARFNSRPLQNSGNAKRTANRYVAPARPIPPAGRSWRSRLVDRAQEFGNLMWNIFRKFGIWAFLLLLAAIFLSNLGNYGDTWVAGHGGFPRLTLPTLSLPSFCCSRVDNKLEVIFNRLDGIDLDLSRIHGTLDALTHGYKPADDGRQVFWVEQDRAGKISIPQDYYEAIKQQILKDKDLLKGISNTTWSPVINRLVADGYLQNRPGGQHLGVDDVANDDINNAWNLWIRQNDAAVVKALQGELDKALAELTERELKDLLAKRNIDLSGGKLLTQKEFEDLYKKEVKGGYSQMLRELADQVEEYKKELEKLKLKPPHGMSTKEVDEAIAAAVKKYTDVIKIEAAAKSRSSAILGNLSGQMNYFTVGSGAVIDPHYTSPTWKPPKASFKSKQWYDRDGYVPQPAVVAIMPWEEEGECFCAGPNLRGQGVGTANLSIMISRDVVPKFVVLEHMLPGATLDSGARPRDVELWAQYEDYHLRQTVEAWSRARWPGTVTETSLPENYVKIDEFTYEDHKVGDGAQLRKINSELVDMDAAASIYVVRAVNNYGADHTCFYRIRMYGEQRDRALGV